MIPSFPERQSPQGKCGQKTGLQVLVVGVSVFSWHLLRFLQSTHLGAVTGPQPKLTRTARFVFIIPVYLALFLLKKCPQCIDFGKVTNTSLMNRNSTASTPRAPCTTKLSAKALLCPSQCRVCGNSPTRAPGPTGSQHRCVLEQGWRGRRGRV